ncbi:hypothetical protein LSAT2_030864, partial [Lamellibrachia satsuma]
RNQIDKLLKTTDLNIRRELSDLADSARSDLVDSLWGKVVAQSICHVWYSRESRQKVIYNSKVEKLKKKTGGTYVIDYWSQDETYDDAVNFEMSKYELSADLVCGDLIFA